MLIGLSLATASPVAASAQSVLPAPPYVAVVDRPMTIAAGTTDLLSIQRTLSAIEDRVLPPTRFRETTAPRRALGVGYRLAKFLAVDLPQDHFVMVVAHEVFGHGARLREFGAPAIGYAFDAPIPYGGGGASTRFHPPAGLARADEVSIATAGIEAQNVLAAAIGGEALARGVLHHREAWLYVESRLAGLRYIRSVSPRSREGHDVAAFLRAINDGCEPPACRPLEPGTLKRQALFMLADPLLASAAYGVAVAYLVQGRARVRAPMIPLPRGARYLPALDVQMTPHGTEWWTVHYVLAAGRLTRIVTRVGDTRRGRTWAAGVTASEAMRRGRVSATVAAAFWRQPPLDPSPSSPRLRTGGLAAVTVRAPLGRASLGGRPLGVLVQVGWKSDGYVPGEPLRGGPILRIGATCGAR